MRFHLVNGTEREKVRCKVGVSREVSGSLQGGYEFLAAAKRYFSAR